MDTKTIDRVTLVVVYAIFLGIAAIFALGLLAWFVDIFDPSAQVRVKASTSLAPLGLLALMYRRIPFYRPQRKNALFERLPAGSPALTAAALRHFRLRSLTRGLLAALVLLLTCDGAVSLLMSHWTRSWGTGLELIVVLVVGAGYLYGALRSFGRLRRAASEDEAARLETARFLARQTAASLKEGSHEDRVAQTIWQRMQPATPALDAQTA